MLKVGITATLHHHLHHLPFKVLVVVVLLPPL
jgi:hypothetical protein